MVAKSTHQTQVIVPAQTLFGQVGPLPFRPGARACAEWSVRNHAQGGRIKDLGVSARLDAGHLRAKRAQASIVPQPHLTASAGRAGFKVLSI